MVYRKRTWDYLESVVLSSMTILNENGKITADIWDFFNDEKSSKDPHVKVGIEHFVFKNIFNERGY